MMLILSMQQRNEMNAELWDTGTQKENKRTHAPSHNIDTFNLILNSSSCFVVLLLQMNRSSEILQRASETLIKMGAFRIVGNKFLTVFHFHQPSSRLKVIHLFKGQKTDKPRKRIKLNTIRLLRKKTKPSSTENHSASTHCR